MTVFLLLPRFLRSHNSFLRLQSEPGKERWKHNISPIMPEVELPLLTISEVDPPTEASLVSNHVVGEVSLVSCQVAGEASLVSSHVAGEASLVSTDDQPVVTSVPVSIENLILVEEEKKRVRKGNKKVGFY